MGLVSIIPLLYCQPTQRLKYYPKRAYFAAIIPKGLGGVKALLNRICENIDICTFDSRHKQNYEYSFWLKFGGATLGKFAASFYKISSHFAQ